MKTIEEWFFGRVVYAFYETVLRRRKTLTYLSEYERQQWLKPQQIRSLQWTKLINLLDYCYKHVPYYRRRWNEAGIVVSDIRTYSDFERLPVLSKDEIRSHYEEFIAEPWRGATLRKTTGGSTGKPFAFEYTRESYERRMAVMLRGYAWAGARLGVRTLHVWGGALGVAPLATRIKGALYDAVLRKKVLNSFEMRIDNLEGYARAIEKYRPAVIIGYTSALEILAQYLRAGRSLAWRPNSVITAAEMLHSDQRTLIEGAFGAPVFHTYGCREFMLIGAECEQHRGYHTSADHLYVEVTDSQNRAIEAGPGDVVVTDLHNYGMPLIRYANGDLAHAHSGECGCGRGLPLLGPVEGRRLDTLRTIDGRVIPGEFFPHLMKEVSGIEQFQVRQKTRSRFDIAIVKRDGFGEKDIGYLRREIARVAGEAVAVEIRFVDNIPLTPSGKRRVTIYEVPQEDI